MKKNKSHKKLESMKTKIVDELDEEFNNFMDTGYN